MRRVPFARRIEVDTEPVPLKHMGEAEETHMVDCNIRWRKKGGWNPKNKFLVIFKF
jgi:hypothetical protein